MAVQLQRCTALCARARGWRLSRADTYEMAWRDYAFQMILPFMRLLVMTPGLARDRRQRVGMFAPKLSQAAEKLSEMYVQLNTRFATALMDLQWPARCAELDLTAPGCCRPCQ